MNVQSIGENAGIVWKQLAGTGLADRDLNAAIGWLAREGKVEIEESKVGRKTIIYLTLCYYIS